MTEVYVAICKDRHCDTVAVVCESFTKAKEEALEWCEPAAERFGVQVAEISHLDGSVSLLTYDDGPSAMIVRTEIKS